MDSLIERLLQAPDRLYGNGNSEYEVYVGSVTLDQLELCCEYLKTEMRRRKPIKPSHFMNELQGYLNKVESQQRNSTWRDLLKNSRSVDEVFWKDSRKAPMVQRIGILVLAGAYFMVVLSLVALALETGSTFTAVFALLPLGIGALFTRNALKK